MKMYIWLNKQKERYYTLAIDKEPNHIILNQRWGGYKSNRGGKKDICVDTEDEAKVLVNKLLKRRKNRGYELIV